LERHLPSYPVLGKHHVPTYLLLILVEDATDEDGPARDARWTYSVWSIASFPGLTWFGASVVVASVIGSLSLLGRDHFV
jgi:hypothetical protein